jgi:hypothetical protein
MLLLLKIEISSNGQNCSILSQNVPKFELYKHNDELFNMYYRFFMNFELLPGTHPGTIPGRLGLIWCSCFRGEDLNVIFYQNMPNLHNRYISAERKIFLDGPLPKLCPVIPTSNQDGRQGQNRKKGG